MIKMNELLVVM